MTMRSISAWLALLALWSLTVVAETISADEKPIYYREPSRGSANRLLINPPYLRLPFGQSADAKGLVLPSARLFVTYPSGLINQQPEDGYPVLLFVSGMYARVPTYWYQDLYTRLAIAGQGMIVVAMDLLTTVPDFSVSTDQHMVNVLNWIKQGHLQSHLAVADAMKGTNKTTTKSDLTRILLGAHSSGAQSLVVALQKTYAGISGVVLLDPVDGMGEFRGYNEAVNVKSLAPVTPFPLFSALQLNSNTDKARLSYPPAVIDIRNQSQLTHIQLPLFVLATGLCAKPALKVPRPPFIDVSKLPPIFTNNDTMWPACCPLDLGPERFWKAFGGSNGDGGLRIQTSDSTAAIKEPQATWGWLMNVTEFGHCDLLDDVWTFTNRHLRLCESVVAARRRSGQWNPYDMKSFRSLIAGTIAAFVDVTLFSKCEAERFLVDPSTMAEKVQLARMTGPNNRCP